jgi:malate dehydrogenase (oxaloacetate-decarboxylating)
MCVAAAEEMATFAEDRGVSSENIIPRLDEWMVFVKVAVACAQKAIEQNVTRIKLTKRQLEERAFSIIKNSRDSIKELMKEKIIPNLDY